MAIPEMSAGAVLGALSGVLQLDPAVLEQLEKILTENSDLLEAAPYQRLQVSEAAFGGSAKAGTLGWHHTRAHEVLAQTVLAMVTDLREFAVGVRTAADGVDAADEDAAADLVRRADRLHSHDQQAYDHARNHQSAEPPPEIVSAPGAADETTSGGQA